MADAVTSQTLVDTSGTKTVMKFTNMSDGSGETLVTKMDASALTFMTEDATKSIAKIWWAVNTTNGKSGVELLWAQVPLILQYVFCLVEVLTTTTQQVILLPIMRH